MREYFDRFAAALAELKEHPEEFERLEHALAALDAASWLVSASLETTVLATDSDEEYLHVEGCLEDSIEAIDLVSHAVAASHGLAPSCLDEDEDEDEDEDHKDIVVEATAENPS